MRTIFRVSIETSATFGLTGRVQILNTIVHKANEMNSASNATGRALYIDVAEQKQPNDGKI